MDSMEKIYEVHSKMIYGFLLSKSGDSGLAEELTQETFFQALKSVDSFKGNSSVSTWLCGIANNLWKQYLSKHKDFSDISEHENDVSVSSAETNVFTELDSMELLKLLHNLPEPGREVVYLRIMGELSFRQIGEIMGRTENWARVTFYRGKEKIAEGARANEE